MHKTLLTVNNHHNGSVSNSDAEPEMQDSEVEMQEDDISESVDNVVPENQEFGRTGPSKDRAIVSRQCINTNKYLLYSIIHVIIICSYMLLHVPMSRVSVTALVQYR